MLAVSHTPASYLPAILASPKDMGYGVKVSNGRHLVYVPFVLFVHFETGPYYVALAWLPLSPKHKD